MTKRKPLPARTFPPGYFSEPVAAGFPPGFVPQIVVSEKTGRFETDYARQNRIRASSGWGTLPWSRGGQG